MSFSDVDIRPLFPTPLIVASFSKDESQRLNGLLVPMILKKAETEKSACITNIGGWQSDTRIMEWGGEPVTTIVNSLRDLIGRITLDLHAKAFHSNVDWKVYGWANVNRKGHLNVSHTHPGAYWSACYYVQTEEIEKNSDLGGEFQIIDPRGTLPITYSPQLRIGVDGFQSCGGHELIKPKTGQCLLFPSWLPHAVLPHSGENVRISLAFNFSV